MSIFSDFITKIMEVFMDNFTVHGDSFDECLDHLTLLLRHCIDINLVLNFEKCHSMVEHGVVLKHVVLSKGLEVDKAKVDITQSLPHPRCVKDVRSFLGHVGFYRRFIKDVSKIASPLYTLVAKNASFVFNDDCMRAFDQLKLKLNTSPIVQLPNWALPFELMCDASDKVVRAVLGQRVGGKPYVIYYTSRTLDSAQCNYTTTEKEIYVVLFTLEKFSPYLLGVKVTVYSDHSALKHLLEKKD